MPNLASAPDAEQASNLILYAIPAFVIAVVAEALWARRHRDDPEIRGYERRDSAASMSMGLINVVVSGFAKLLSIPFFAWLYQHRVADIGTAWWAWIVLLLGEDLCYYWFHRVHHGSNEVYLDRNYGGILIVWDRLFGTFQGETERVRYGLTQNIRSFRPTHVAFHEFAAIWRDVREATTWRHRLGYLFRGPGWSPDGSGGGTRG